MTDLVRKSSSSLWKVEEADSFWEPEPSVIVPAIHWKIPNLLAFTANLVCAAWFWKAEGLPESLGLFSPENYAQGIWGLIYLAEMAFTTWQLLVYSAEVPEPAVDVLRAVSPSWCATHVFATLATATDDERLATPEMRWINSVILSCVSASLCFAYLAVTRGVLPSQADAALTAASLNIMAIPVTLHFGWSLIEALESWSSYAAVCGLAAWANLVLGLLFVLLVKILGSFLTTQRCSPVLGFTLAWGIVAIGVRTMRSDALQKLGTMTDGLCAATEFFVGAGLFFISWREQHRKADCTGTSSASSRSARVSREFRRTQRRTAHWKIRQSERQSGHQSRPDRATLLMH